MLNLSHTSNSRLSLNGCNIALGNFDGLHLGHQKLISACIESSKKNKNNSVVYTFYPHPEQVLSEKFIGYVFSQDIKKSIIESLGADCLLTHIFDKHLAATPPEEFALKYLVEPLRPKKIFIGFNYRFGKDRAGNYKILQELGNKYNFDVEIIPAVTINNTIVSSSRIRKLILDGNIEEVNKMLGYCYKLQGKVISGAGMGKKIGFPTANITTEKENLLFPKPGVYATYCIVNGVRYKSATNIGYKPTFSGENFNIETHIFDFAKDIYNQTIEILFVERVRNEIKFSEISSLKNQINEDIGVIKRILK